MNVFYPRCRVFLRVIWEDFGKDEYKTQREQVYLLQDPPVLDVEVVNNDYSQADTFKLTIPFSWFPFDPRLIRACGVAIYMGGVDSPEKDIEADANATAHKNLQLLGFVDDLTEDLGDQLQVVMEGRDQTALLIDEHWNAFIETKEGKENVRLPAGIDLRRPLDQVLRYILDKFKATKTMKVELRGVSAPTLGKWHALGEAEISEDATAWDVIKHLVHQAGLICFVEFDTLVVTNAKALMSATQVAGSFVHGWNLTSLTLKRKLGRMKATNIRVRSFDINTKRTLTGVFPQKPVEKVKISAKGEVTKEQPFIDFTVPNVADKAQLEKIAENIYTQRSRQQLEGKLKTEDLTSLVGNRELELTQLRSGSAIRVELDPEDRAQLRGLDVAKREAYLQHRGYAAQVAKVVARAFNDLDSAFYVKAATKRYSHEEGFSCDVDFVNFISGDKP